MFPRGLLDYFNGVCLQLQPFRRPWCRSQRYLAGRPARVVLTRINQSLVRYPWPQMHSIHKETCCGPLHASRLQNKPRIGYTCATSSKPCDLLNQRQRNLTLFLQAERLKEGLCLSVGWCCFPCWWDGRYRITGVDPTVSQLCRDGNLGLELNHPALRSHPASPTGLPKAEVEASVRAGMNAMGTVTNGQIASRPDATDPAMYMRTAHTSVSFSLGPTVFTIDVARIGFTRICV